MNENCECPVAGFCVRYNKNMSERMHDICQGRVLTEAKCDAYRKSWLEKRETGLGDVVAGITKATGIAAITKAVAKATGKNCGCSGRQKKLNQATVNRAPFRFSKGSVAKYITTQQLTLDTLKLAAMLPPDVTRICGIARSGLTPATLLAQFLHLPLDLLRPQAGDIISANNGWRLGKSPVEEGVTLIVDDTMMTGNSFRQAWPLAQANYKNPAFAVVYFNPNAREVPCYFARELPWPHILEWNLFNSILTPACAYDMDGVICEDCPPRSNDDGSRYLDFLQNAEPKFLTRRLPIPLIVTARHEKYREQTLRWLAKWGVRVDRLVMRQDPVQGDWTKAIAAFKAKEFKQFLKTKSKPGPRMFLESCPHQAKEIARLSGGLVVCPPTGECFQL